MKSTIIGTALVAAATLTSMTLSVADVTAAGVTPTKPDCISAWALLAPGSASGKEAVQSVVRWHRHWDASGYEPFRSQKFSLQVFDVVTSNRNVTVAHCGHGATCNALADAVLKAYPNVGQPVVYCTAEPPPLLANPQTM